MILLDYIVNLAIFSLLVSIPLVIRSFINHKPFKRARLWASIYGGIVSVILIMLSIREDGYSYDIRYAPVILIYTFFGPVAGILTGSFALIARLFTSGQWYPVITGWMLIMTGLFIIHLYTKHLNYVKRCMAMFGVYVFAYVLTVLIFHILLDNPLFHFEYLLFVFLGVIIGGLLIESYVKLYSLNSRLTDMYKLVEASELKYRLIAENTSDLIMVMDKEHAVSYFSPSHEHVLGYKCSELEKSKLCKFIHPDDVSLFRKIISEMFISEKSHSMEFRLGHKAGHWIVFESRCMPVKGENQLIESIVIISRDISERRKAEEFLLQSEKLSIVGELAAGVAHEIRNPLTTIKGFVQLYKAENSSIVYNDLLLSELERIETITSELLALGKPQAVQMNRLNLKDLMESTLELLSPQAHMNAIQFKLSVEKADFYITGEKNQLKQVFLNVLKNAMESMADGGEIYITIQRRDEGECIISFQDQGIGIPEEILPRLGEPFYTLKEKGTGLGLMICHKIIKQHHGSITYQSKINEGTLVEITLPLIH